MKKLLIRTLSGIVYVAVVVGAIFSGSLLCNDKTGSAIFSGLFLVVGLIATYEVVDGFAKKGITVRKTTTFFAAALTYLLSVATISPYLFNNRGIDLILIIPAVMLCPFLIQLWDNSDNPFAKVSYSILPSIWVMVPLATLSYLHLKSPYLVMSLFIMVWVNDSFAYLTGMMLGKHKMWQRHSPNKTWEGTIGGVVAAIAAALIISHLWGDKTNTLWYDWVAIGLICSIIGTLGDLVESMFKRYCGIKDSGKIMPGHGGMLDRFDSMFLSAPFVATYLIIVH